MKQIEKDFEATIDGWTDTIMFLFDEYKDKMSAGRRDVAMMLTDKFTDKVWEICDDLDFSDDEDVEAYEEPYNECGFDPYMGCYSYDC